MNEFINILKNNWEIIIAVIIFILSFILQLIKKRPVNDVLSWIYETAVEAVNSVEASDIKGASYKKDTAIAIVVKKLEEVFPQIDVKVYLKMISLVIEKLLSTPQKKGGNVDGK